MPRLRCFTDEVNHQSNALFRNFTSGVFFIGNSINPTRQKSWCRCSATCFADDRDVFRLTDGEQAHQRNKQRDHIHPDALSLYGQVWIALVVKSDCMELFRPALTHGPIGETTVTRDKGSLFVGSHIFLSWIGEMG